MTGSCTSRYFQSVTHCAKHMICRYLLPTLGICSISSSCCLPPPRVCSCFINGFEFAIFYFAKCRVISHERNPENLYILLSTTRYLPEAELHYVTNITCIFFEHWNFLGLDVRESLVFVVNSAEAGRKNSTIRTKRPYHRFSVKSRHAQENLKKYRVL